VVLGFDIRNNFFFAIGNSHNLSSKLGLATLDYLVSAERIKV
jgi:hypothetical protein